MSQHETASSDSEDDLDYVPQAEDDSSESDDDAVAPQASVEESKEDLDEKKKARDTLWASFQASVSTPPIPTQQETIKKLVKIEKKYLFAGKHVLEVVEVPEDSDDAKKWPLWQPQPSPSPQPAAEKPASVDVGGSSSSLVAPGTPPPAPGKRPGPRKARTALPSLPKAGSSQAKKITTLDKSAMDWRTHLSSQSGDVQEELNANRRGGGYLEKVEFLKRVEDRREDVLEASKAVKRRKT